MNTKTMVKRVTLSAMLDHAFGPGTGEATEANPDATRTLTTTQAAETTPSGRCVGRIILPYDRAGPKEPILKADGFAKKKLATWHLDIIFSCEALCTYCSSDCGVRMALKKQTILEAIREHGPAFGFRLTEEEAALPWPELSPRIKPLSFQYDDEEFLQALARQIEAKGKGFGKGETLVFSEFTDAFSPGPVHRGLTRRALELIFEGTSFRVRVLTKSSLVGRPEWIDYFGKHKDRVVVGLSTGSLDDDWARRVEAGTSVPSARIRALHALQDAGIPTYAMLCPVFPHVLEGDHLERLVDAHRIDRCEHVWAETFNDSRNWKVVRASLAEGSAEAKWFDEVYGNGRMDQWSSYATEQYVRLRRKALDEGWIGKLRYLLYERDVTAKDAAAFVGLQGVLLQSKPGPDGLSPNPNFHNLQAGGCPPGRNNGDIEMKAIVNAPAEPGAREVLALSPDDVAEARGIREDLLQGRRLDVRGRYRLGVRVNQLEARAKGLVEKFVDLLDCEVDIHGAWEAGRVVRKIPRDAINGAWKKRMLPCWTAWVILSESPLLPEAPERVPWLIAQAEKIVREKISTRTLKEMHSPSPVEPAGPAVPEAASIPSKTEVPASKPEPLVPAPGPSSTRTFEALLADERKRIDREMEICNAWKRDVLDAIRDRPKADALLNKDAVERIEKEYKKMVKAWNRAYAVIIAHFEARSNDAA